MIKNGRLKKWIVGLFVCCIIAVIMIFSLFTRLKQNRENTDIPLPQLDSDIDISDEEIGFCYCVYKDVYRYAVERKNNLIHLTVEDVVERYIEIAELNDISIDCVKTKKVMNEKQISKGIYYPEATTYEVYLKGKGIEVTQVNGLISTLLSYFDTVKGNEYVKIYLNNQLQKTSEQMPEPGYFIQRQTSYWEKARDKAGYEENEGKSTNVKFVLKDENKNAMKNIIYYIEGSDKGEMITDSTGEIELSLKSNNQYMLRLQRKNSIVYGMYGENASIYEEMVVCFEVNEEFEQQLIWDEACVTKLCEAENKIIIDVTDFANAPYEDILVSVNKHGASYEIGYCEDDGTIVWNDYGQIADNCILTLIHNDIETYYEAKINDGVFEIIGETTEEPKIAE